MKYKMKAIVGLPGSGKSTVGNLLRQLPEFVLMDFGKTVRSLSASSYLGKTLKNYIMNGESFPPEENLKLLNYILCKYEQDKAFDPRNQTIITCGNFGKAENVDVFKNYFNINQVFVLEIDENIARKRLANVHVQRPSAVSLI